MSSVVARARQWLWQTYAGKAASLPGSAHAEAAAHADRLASRHPRVLARKPCAICASSRLQVAHAGKKPIGVRLYPGAPRLPLAVGARLPLIYEQCTDCGAARINPTFHDEWIDFVALDAAAVTRAAPTHWMEAADYVADKQASIAAHHERLSLQRFRSAHNSVLDVSCGSGVGLDVLRRRFGWADCRGVECDVAARRAAVELRGLAVERGLVHQVKLPADHFDLAIFDNSLEHHADPRAAVRCVRQALRRGGGLTIVVPNFHGYAVELLGTDYGNLNWGHWHYFTVQSLRRLLHEEGFHVERAYCDGVEAAVLERRGGSSPGDAHVDLDAEAVAALPYHERAFRGDYVTVSALAT